MNPWLGLPPIPPPLTEGERDALERYDAALGELIAKLEANSCVEPQPNQSIIAIAPRNRALSAMLAKRKI